MVVLLVVLCLVLLVVGWRRRRAQKRHRVLLHRLRLWLGTQGSSDPALARWIAGLSASEADVLLTLLMGYCTSLNWELTWLFTPHLRKVPALHQAMAEGIMAYVRAILTSLQLLEDVHAYNAYVALLHRPTSRRQSTLVQQLYQAFNEQGLIPVAAYPRHWFRRQPSRKEKSAAVIDAFEREPLQAMATLKMLLTMAAVADVQQFISLSTGVATAT